jgi:hypothetical protein
LWAGGVAAAVAGGLLVAVLYLREEPAPPPRPKIPELSAVARSNVVGPPQPLPSQQEDSPKPVRRAALGSLILHTVVPDHVGLTSAPLPSLFWHLSELPPEGSVLHFVVEDVLTTERLIDMDLPPAQVVGLQRIDLWRYGHELPEFRSCRWWVTLTLPNTAEPLTADGWIRRVSLPPQVVEDLRGAPTERFPEVYAGAGLWYDALTLLVNNTESDADDARAWSNLRALLEQAQLTLL